MKKLVTAFAACALAGLAFAQVESVNIVGYKTESFATPRGQPMQFVKVGGGTTLLTDILDMSTVAPFADLLLIYNPVNGVFVDYMWNEVSWFNTLTDEEVEIEIVPGNAFLVLASGDWLFTGEVASITTYDHPIEAGIPTFVGNAFPADTTLANFDWSAIEPYADLLLLYDAVNGVFVDYMFDGADWFNTLNDEILPSSTPLNDGFLILTGLTSITQSLVVQ